MASGRTPGVRASADPAAAPLGTDDEAAGTPPSRQAAEHEIERARQGRGRAGLTAAEAMEGRPGRADESPRKWDTFVTVAAAVIIAIALIAWIVLS